MAKAKVAKKEAVVAEVSKRAYATPQQSVAKRLNQITEHLDFIVRKRHTLNDKEKEKAVHYVCELYESFFKKMEENGKESSDKFKF